MEKRSPRDLTKKGKLTKHDMKALEFIQLAEGATDALKVNAAQRMAMKLGAKETYRRLFSTFEYKGMHVLHYSARFGRIVLTHHLVEFLGININKKDSTGRSVLHFAVLLNSGHYIGYVIEKLGANVDIKDNLGITPLHQAILAGNHMAMHELLKKGADTNIGSPYGKPMHAAAARMDDVAVNALINKQVDVNDMIDMCLNPLACSVYHGAITSLEALLKAGADVHLSKLISKAVVTNLSSTESMVKILLDHHADPNEVDEGMFEDAPIIAAAKRNQLSVIELLINRSNPIEGVDWNLNGIMAYVGSAEFKEHDAVHKEQRVAALHERMMEGLKNTNYLLSAICCLALKNDMNDLEWDRCKSLCDFYILHSIDSRKPELRSEFLRRLAIDSQRLKNNHRAIMTFKASLALDPNNDEAEKGLRVALGDTEGLGTSGEI